MQRRVLFLCTGNTARSQIAEALLQKYAGDHFQVFSAGAEPKDEIFPPAVEVMKEIGIDISDRKAKGLEIYLGKVHFEKVIIVCSEANKNCPQIFGATQRLYWPFDDPTSISGNSEKVLAFTRNIRDQIDAKIHIWLKEQGIEINE
jgi:arsenate reductase